MTDEPAGAGPGAQRRFLDALPEIVASATTGAVDLAMTGTPSTGALAPVLGLLIRLGADARTSRERRGQRLLETAADQLDGLDRLADAATSDEARLELTVRVIEAAMRTAHERKVRALGRVLANGLGGHATVDQAQILAAALDAIEAPHIQVLAILCENADAHGDVPQPQRADLLPLSNDQIAERLPGHETVLGALIQILASHHLIEPAAVTGGLVWGHPGAPKSWVITDLGRACLVLVEDA